MIALTAAAEPARSYKPRALIMTPTRELAIQVKDSLEPYAHAVGVSIRLVAGGLPYAKQIDGLRKGADILVATPGRLTDLVDRGSCDLSEAAIVVLDEADQMADMGFLPAVTALMDKTPRDGQRLLFSATLDKDVQTLVRRFLTDPVEHSVAPTTVSISTMTHHVLHIAPKQKFTTTAAIAARHGRTILFVRTQKGADRVTSQLREVGVRAEALHGGLSQNHRNRAIDAFRSGRSPVLVATDVAARGIHVDDVTLVLHVDPPADPKDYLHRAGRTARAGASGTVVTLALPDQRRTVARLLEQAGVGTVSPLYAGPEDQLLADVTGARRPSGEPVVFTAPARPARSGPRRPSRGPRHTRGARPEAYAPDERPLNQPAQPPPA